MKQNLKLPQKILTEKMNSYGDFFYNYYRTIHGKTLVSFDRLLSIYNILEQIKLDNTKGAIAECGVYKGGTAKLIAEYCKNNDMEKDIYLFDSFSGMPECDKEKDLHKKGDFADTNLSHVQNLFLDMPNVKIYDGFFPKTIRNIHYKKYSFVHIDFDIYDSYMAALTMFHQLMETNGAILCDDYGFPTCPGAKKAVDEFYVDKVQKVVPLKTNQCIIYY